MDYNYNNVWIIIIIIIIHRKHQNSKLVLVKIYEATNQSISSPTCSALAEEGRVSRTNSSYNCTCTELNFGKIACSLDCHVWSVEALGHLVGVNQSELWTQLFYLCHKEKGNNLILLVCRRWLAILKLVTYCHKIL